MLSFYIAEAVSGASTQTDVSLLVLPVLVHPERAGGIAGDCLETSAPSCSGTSSSTSTDQNSHNETNSDRTRFKSHNGTSNIDDFDSEFLFRWIAAVRRQRALHRSPAAMLHKVENLTGSMDTLSHRLHSRNELTR